MDAVIPPIDKALIKAELTQNKLLRHTNNNSNEIYVITHHNAPHTMQEVGRLREEAFRAAGGGTGKKADIDDFDTADLPYKQLIVWDEEEQEILGGYRFIVCDNPPKDEHGNIMLATSNLFHLSETFIRDYLPYTIELGRSFVQPKYQSKTLGRKALFALDNLWDGLGALVIENPQIKLFFGKVTMYPHYNQRARDMILYFLSKHFDDPDNLVRPYKPLNILTNRKELEKEFTGKTLSEDYKILSQAVRNLNENIPPLINAYINLSPSMRTFGTSLNPHFGNVEETAILLTIDDIYLNKKSRHLNSYIKNV